MYFSLFSYLISNSLMSHWRFTRGVEEQTKAFMEGFYEVVPLRWLEFFNEKELEVSAFRIVQSR